MCTVAGMRPVDKGVAPRVYTTYNEAGPDLRACLGDYCSYCERHIETHLAVEHVQPKSRRAALRTQWENLLLACVQCNSSKGNKRIALRNYFWPDRDNTLRALDYRAGGIVVPAAALTDAEREKADNTLRLTGMDKVPGAPGREPTESDQRWLRRQQGWLRARVCRDRLIKNDTPEVRECIVEIALARGLFSIWWSVFADDIDMRRRLRVAFVGTHGDSFGANEQLVPRSGGQL